MGLKCAKTETILESELLQKPFGLQISVSILVESKMEFMLLKTLSEIFYMSLHWTHLLYFEVPLLLSIYLAMAQKIALNLIVIIT